MPEYEHRELSSRQETKPRRKQSSGRTFSRGDGRQRHAEQLVQQAEVLQDTLQARRQTAPAHIDPKLIFKLTLNPKATFDESRVRSLGLRMLAHTPQRAVVVFPDEPTIAEMRNRLGQHAAKDGHDYAYLTAIDEIGELTAADRLGNRLREQPLEEDEVVGLDIELWHSGVRTQCSDWIGEIDALLQDYQDNELRITDRFIGETLCVIRVKVNATILPILLSIDFIKEIDRRPSPSFDMRDLFGLELGQLERADQPPADAVGIVILDSGVMAQHPLIAPALGEAEVFPDALRERIRGGPEDGDLATGGHGTAVAGIAIYDSVQQCIDERTFRPMSWLFSARVTDENNEYDEDTLLETQLATAVTYFVENYPIVKVINISLGHPERIYSDNDYQFRFAAAIDELAYRYRERQIVFVVSAGNFAPDHAMTADEVMARYPTYLLEDPSARIIDPATAALAITVGGLSNGLARDIQGYLDHDINRPVAMEAGWPSSITRAGWGVGGSIKPEVVELAGDLMYERGRLTQALETGLTTINKTFVDGRLFRTVIGTSYAAPRVANLAARLFQAFPSATSNLIRALIADSAEVPAQKPEALSEKEWHDKDLLRVYGYGQPDYERARFSAENRTLLLHEGHLAIDQFQIFELPPLPLEFLTASGVGTLSITLAFDPPTRATRSNDYLGVTMSFELFRNTEIESVENLLRSYSKQEKEALPSKKPPGLTGVPTRQRVKLKPGSTLRGKGTLQKGICRVPSRAWHYDGTSLYLGVMCHRTSWTPANIINQSFAVVVSAAHESDDVRIHANWQLRTRQYQRVRQRARA